MTLEYALTVLLIASGLGMTAWNLSPGSSADRLAAAALAAAQTPPFIATIQLMFAWLVPASPLGKAVLALAPVLVVAIATVGSSWYSKRHSPQPHWQFRERLPRRWEWDLVLFAGVAVTGFLLFSVAKILAANLFPTMGSDALIYLSEARAFVESGNPAILIQGDGDPANGAPPTHPHFPLFTFYLVHALLFVDPPIEPLKLIGNDMPVRIAFQGSILFLVLAIAGLAILVVRMPGYRLLAACFAVAGFCLFPAFEYMSFASSCDAFRLVPMLAFAGLLISVARSRALPLFGALILAVLAFFFLGAHTINIYFGAILSAVLLAGFVAQRVPLKQSALAAACTAAGGAIVAAHYIYSYLETGRFFGNGMNYYHYTATVLESAFRNYGNWGGEKMSFASAFHKVMVDHGAAPAYLSVAAAGGLLLYSLSGPRAERIGMALLCLAYLAMLLVPLLQPAPDRSIGMKEALVGNYRYAHTFFVIAPVIIAALICTICEYIERNVNTYAGLFLIAVACAGLALGGHHGLKSWRTYSSHKEAEMERQVAVSICPYVYTLIDGDVWLSDRTSLAYACSKFPTYLYSPRGRTYYTPKSQDEQIALLEGSRVGLVTLRENIPGWWPETPLVQALNALTRAGKFERKSIGSWTVYIRQ